MNAASVDIKDLLVANTELGLEFTKNLFIGFEPEAPDTCVTIYDTPGYASDIIMTGNDGYEYPSVQIQVRSDGYIEAFTIADDIRNYLHGKHHVKTDDCEYQVIDCTSPPFMLNRDENNRVKFVINLDLQRSSIQ
jgi:hypothetical protein